MSLRTNICMATRGQRSQIYLRAPNLWPCLECGVIVDKRVNVSIQCYAGGVAPLFRPGTRTCPGQTCKLNAWKCKKSACRGIQQVPARRHSSPWVPHLDGSAPLCLPGPDLAVAGKSLAPCVWKLSAQADWCQWQSPAHIPKIRLTQD